MKKLSITARIMIWYTVFLVVIAALLSVMLLQVQNSQERALAEQELAELLTDVCERIENEMPVDRMDIDSYQKGVYISVYDTSGELLVGRRPASFAEFPGFLDKTAITVHDTRGTEWYVYDTFYQSEENRLWVRGMMKHAAHTDTRTFLLRFLLIAVPGLILFAMLGGWWITRRAFRPLRDIIRTTDDIRADADVSRRVPEGENRDELYALTRSINGMFDRVESVLKREKQFSSDVSHELRTPIAVIQSQSGYALEYTDYSEQALERISRQARHMNSLVSRLLTLSRSDAGTLPLSPEDINFSELLTDIAEQQQIALEEEDIAITADIEEGVHVSCDRDALIRIILNLISNAVRYGRTPVPEGSSSVSPAGTIRLTLASENGMAVCTVADSGPGIPEAEQEKIWDRLYQIDRTRSSAEPSAGLGLAMVQALTKASGGTVSLKSEEGHGAAFTIRLPLHDTI